MRETVFISHSSTDSETAAKLVEELEIRKLPCWIAPRNIPLGGEYDAEIMSALVCCKALIVLVSKDSISSRHVRAEVSRASAEGKPIYPVRLVDIEVAGGLQFHLELSQWVDFFPDPTKESYDQLADAIRSGRTSSKGAVRFRSDPRKWALMTLTGMALLFAVSLLGVWAYLSQLQNSENSAAFEELRRSLEQRVELEQDRERADYDKLDVNPVFQTDIDGIYLSSIYVNSPPPNGEPYRIEYVLNDQPAQFFPHDATPQRAKMQIIGLEQLIFRIVRLDGSVIKELDKTAELLNTISREIQQIDFTLSRQGSGSRSACTIAGCAFQYARAAICDPAVAGVNLEKDGVRHPIPRSYCNRQDLTQDYCIPAQDLPFRLVPGQEVTANYELIDGTSRSVGISITGNWVNTVKSYAEVSGIADQAADVPPVMVANYAAPEITGGKFSFFVGWGACSEAGQLASHRQDLGKMLYVDLDGRGMIRLDRTIEFGAAFIPGDLAGQSYPNAPLSLPAGPQRILVGFGDENGVENGPWNYDFDPAEIVRATTARGQIPRIACSGDQTMPRHANFFAAQEIFCIAEKPYAFFDVKAVEFGPNPGNFTQRIDLDFDAETYLSASCDLSADNCPPFIFNVPDSWKNIYSRVVREDGSMVSETRHTYQSEN